MKPIKIWLIGLCLILGFSTCKKDCKCQDAWNPDCENYDPCYGKKPVSADFVIEKGYAYLTEPEYSKSWINDPFETYPWGHIRFTCKDKTLKCKWLLGSEIIEEKSFWRSFSDKDLGTITVTLMVEGTPNISCFPNDDGKDTLTKTFKLVCWDKCLSTQTMKGVFDDLPTNQDSSIIKIIWSEANRRALLTSACPYDVGNSNSSPVLINYKFLNDTFWTQGVRNFYVYNTKIKFGGSGNGDYKGELVIDIDNKVRAEYTFKNIKRIFTGRVLK